MEKYYIYFSGQVENTQVDDHGYLHYLAFAATKLVLPCTYGHMRISHVGNLDFDFGFEMEWTLPTFPVVMVESDYRSSSHSHRWERSGGEFGDDKPKSISND